MRRSRLAILCGSLALLGLAACNREALDTETAATTPPPADTAPATGASPTAAESGTLTLASGSAGSYVADSMGRALYILEGDDTGTKCTGECLQAWRPLLTSGDTAPLAGASLQGGLVGTVQRSDGASQVTYNGHPLYYYSADTGAGTTKGQGIDDQWGEWYLVGSTGLALGETDTDAGVTAEAPDEAAANPPTTDTQPADATDTDAADRARTEPTPTEPPPADDTDMDETQRDGTRY